MKACPFCAEKIQDEAVKCRFCGEFLDGRSGSAPAQGSGAAASTATSSSAEAQSAAEKAALELVQSWKFARWYP